MTFAFFLAFLSGAPVFFIQGWKVSHKALVFGLLFSFVFIMFLFFSERNMMEIAC